MAYFCLEDDDTIESYREWSLAYVRPVMRSMPSVVSFLDFAVTGSMDSGDATWHGCEIVEITDFAAFEQDNRVGEGDRLAAQWRQRLRSWSIGYLEDLEQVPGVVG